MKPLTELDYLMGRSKIEHLPEQSITNLLTLLPKINELLELFGESRTITSGYRTPEINKASGGSAKSCHLTCEAIDLSDKDGRLKAWCINNIKVLEALGLYMEAPARTPTWCHLQSRKTKRRIFLP